MVVNRRCVALNLVNLYQYTLRYTYFESSMLHFLNITFLISIFSIELLLQYTTMLEKDHVIRKMLKSGVLPELLTSKYNKLIYKLINPNRVQRIKINA